MPRRAHNEEAILRVLRQVEAGQRGSDSATAAYQILVDATTLMYFISFLYMFLAFIAMRHRPDRGREPGQTLVPFGQAGVWVCGLLGFSITVLAMVISLIPPGDLQGSRIVFEIKVVGICVVLIASGLILYWRRGKRVPTGAGGEPPLTVGVK